MALKCGSCHEKSNMKRAKGASGLSISERSTGAFVRNGGGKRAIGYSAEGRRWPPHAVQPMSGGMAPTTAPTHVFQIVRRFIHVYTPE